MGGIELTFNFKLYVSEESWSNAEINYKSNKITQMRVLAVYKCFSQMDNNFKSSIRNQEEADS